MKIKNQPIDDSMVKRMLDRKSNLNNDSLIKYVKINVLSEMSLLSFVRYSSLLAKGPNLRKKSILA
jgi:hypothetical protein